MTWLDELDFNPERPWLQMGTRGLDAGGWLIIDDQRDIELEEKRRLLSERVDEVLATSAASREAAEELLDLVRVDLAARGIDEPAMPDGLHPLDHAGRIVQEDLCLLERRMVEGQTRWCLESASLCFPSRWRLRDKLGLPLGAVHGPVKDYSPVLVERVERLLDSLADRASRADESAGSGRLVHRRNWFVHPDNSLFQPIRPTREPVIDASRAEEELWLRSERQTLRPLPKSGWIVFTIRIQQATLGDVFIDPSRRHSFERFLREASASDLAHRGLSGDQVLALT